MTCFFCIPTYKSFDHCANAVKAALASTVPVKVIVLDNSPNASAINYLQDVDCEIWQMMRNIGVAASWNTFMTELEGEDYIVISNDDVFVHPGTVEELINAANRDKNQVFFAGANSSGNSFSLFLLKQEGYKKIGPFDEQFYPAYFEDNDYSRRAGLLGYKLVVVPRATYDHIGSSTMKKYSPTEMEQHHQAFRRNREYYITKWGGEPHHENFLDPFNKKE